MAFDARNAEFALGHDFVLERNGWTLGA